MKIFTHSVVQITVTAIILFAQLALSFCQDKVFSLHFKLSVADDLKNDFKSCGRLFLFMGTKPNSEPRKDIHGMQKSCIFGKNYIDWNADDVLSIDNSEGWDIYQPKNFLLADDPYLGWVVREKWGFNNVPEGIYYLQFLWDQNEDESNINATGNLFSEPFKIEANKSQEIEIVLSEIIPHLQVFKHELVKEVQFQSDTLSKWWGKPVILKAAVLLPSEYYNNPVKEYPIRYDLPGYGLRYTKVNWYMEDSDFRDWWLSGEAPQLITVFLDGEGPYGDSFQIDSEAGPYGYALIHELIPYIEEKYRNTQSYKTRFVSGCSAGGWGSLALQLFYPETFNGVFSYAPAPVDFHNFFLIDIYNDKNLYINEFGHPRPMYRSIYGEIEISMEDGIQWERVLSPYSSYMGSRWMLSDYMELFSPKGVNGKPLSLFDEKTGKINNKVADYWKKYDLLIFTKENWEELGPKIQGKIYILVGDMDGSYLNVSVRSFDDFLKSTKNPKSDAVIEFIPMYGHCWGASQYNRIMKVAERLAEIEKENNNRP
jgi:S-formylglutathione hydrolase FrmB